MGPNKTFWDSVHLMEELFGMDFAKIQPTFSNTVKLAFCWHKIENPKCKKLFSEWLNEMDENPDELNQLCFKIGEEMSKL